MVYTVYYVIVLQTGGIGGDSGCAALYYIAVAAYVGGGYLGGVKVVGQQVTVIW